MKAASREWYKVDIPRWIAGEYKRLTPERRRVNGVPLASAATPNFTADNRDACHTTSDAHARHPSNDLTAARARIAAAYDPGALEAAGTRLMATLAEHFRRVESRDAKVLNWNEPAALVARSAALAGQRCPRRL